MKKIIFSIIALFFITQVFAQHVMKDTSLANKHFEKAKIFNDSAKYKTAIEYFKKASVLYKKHKLWRKYLLSETKHGQCYQKQWKLDKAITIIKPAIEKTLKHINKNDTIVADAYFALCYQYYFKSKLDSSIYCVKQTLEIRKELFGENHADVALCYSVIGQNYYYKNDYDLAMKNHFKALALRKKTLGKKHSEVAKSYNYIGNIYRRQNKNKFALKYYFNALQMNTEIFGKKHYSVADCYNNIGIAYRTLKQYDLAIQYYSKSSEIIKNVLGENHRFTASIYKNMGVIYDYMKEYDLALQYHFKALKIDKKLYGKISSDVAVIYINIGNTYKNKNEFELGLEYLFKSLKILKTIFGETHIYIAANYSGIGTAYLYNKKYDLALEYFYKDLEISIKLLGQKHESLAKSYINIGHAYFLKKDYATSLKYYHKSTISNLKNVNDTVNIYSVPPINSYLSWSNLLKALQEKANIIENNSINLPKFKTNLKRQQIAMQHYQACDTLIGKARMEIITKSDKLTLGKEANNVYTKAVDLCLDMANNESNKKKALELKNQAFYFSERNKTSVLLESIAGSDALNFTNISDTLIKKEEKLRLDIANYTNRKVNAKNDSLKEIWSNSLFDANISYNKLIANFETQYPEFYNLKYNRKQVTTKQLSALLDKKTAVLNYFVKGDTVTIFAISKKNFVVTQTYFNDSLQNNSLQDEIYNYNYSISQLKVLQDEAVNNEHWSESEYNRIANNFYKLLFPKKIQDFLKAGIFNKIENLIIIPDGHLVTIPFETLHTQKYKAKWTNWKNYDYFSNMPYLINNYNISYNYSATLLHQINLKNRKTNTKQNTSSDWLALAPVFDDEKIAGTTLKTRKLLTYNNKQAKEKTRSFISNGEYISSLPASLSEVNTIFNLFKKNGRKALLKTHLQANEDFIKSGNLQNYKILHFATHGFVNESNPELSGLLLAQDTSALSLQKFETSLNTELNEGILYQNEIYNLKLNSELVVLSACETGLGKLSKGEGIIGLTRALLYAGSKNILVSLWQVSDKSTSVLMVDFYKNLLNSKKLNNTSFSKHVSEAKRQMIRNKKYAHPFYWSPFILIGK